MNIDILLLLFNSHPIHVLPVVSIMSFISKGSSPESYVTFSCHVSFGPVILGQYFLDFNDLDTFEDCIIWLFWRLSLSLGLFQHFLVIRCMSYILIGIAQMQCCVLLTLSYQVSQFRSSHHR